MSNLDLVARLRRNPMGLELAAADRIEELEAQLAAQQAQTAPVVPHPAMWSGSLTLTIERLTDDAEMYDRLGHNSTAEDRRARAYELTSLLAALSAAPSAPIQANSEDAKDATELADDGIYCKGCDCPDDELDPCGTAERLAKERRAIAATAQQKEGE